MPTVRLGKTGFHFNATHHFPEDPGYDRLQHGHDYEMTVLLEGQRAPGAMLFDMRDLKEIVRRDVIDRLDHKDLNEILPDPSLEALTEWIWTQLRTQIPASIRIGVIVWETRSIYAEFWGE
jgi:6-pyruvoyltetrahydropterin/6-carboxytetrahydropterin synthase